MIEQVTISISIDEVEQSSINNYLDLGEITGEFLLLQRKEDSQFYFLCSKDCPIKKICESLDWYIVSKDRFNDSLIIGAGLADKDHIEGLAYRVKDEATLELWKDILTFTFESNFIRRFFPYENHFTEKARIDGCLCFFLHDYYPVSHQKNISTYQESLQSRFSLQRRQARSIGS